jgi:gliding motility-associated-like protein
MWYYLASIVGIKDVRIFFLCVGITVQVHAQIPTTGPANFSTSNIVGNSLKVNWTRGNGTNVLVIASTSSSFYGTGIPSNGTDYNANATFGSGDPVGTNNFVVYRGTSTSVTISGLIHSTSYYFRIYEFNGINFSTQYNTVNVLAGSGTTLLPPTVGSTNFGATFTGNSASLTWTRGDGTRSLMILQQGSSPPNPIQYTSYSASTNFASGSVVGSGYVVYFNSSNSVNVTNLQPNTQYYYRIIEGNGTTGTVFDLSHVLAGSFTTGTTPTTGSSAVSISNVQGDRFTLSFTSGNGTQRLIVARQGGTVAWSPSDGVDYNVNSVFGSGDNLGSNTFAVGQTTASGLTITGLTPATAYYVAIFEFNGIATNTYYLSTPTQVATGQTTTISPPSNSAGGFAFTNITGHDAMVSFTAGNGAKRLVLARAGAAVTEIPVNLVSYSSDDDFIGAPSFGTSKIVYDGTGTSFTFSSLQPNTTYHFAVFEYNGSTGPVYKQADPGIGSFTTSGKPTVAPTALTFSSIEGDRMTIGFTTGNGLGRTIIAKQGSPVDIFPTDLTTYSANQAFGTPAAHIGNGNYVIQNNTALNTTTNVGVTGLLIGQTYYFAVIESNGTGTERLYMTGAQALTGSKSTLSAPTTQAANISFSGITSNSVTVSWQNGNGNGRTLLIRQGQAVQSLPVDLSSYTSNANYGSSPALGTSKIVLNGTANSVTITNLPPGQYHFAVVEYNGSSRPVYRSADPLIGNVTVGSKPVVPASALSFSSTQGDRMTLSFTKGDGISRMVIAKAGGPVDAWPADFNGYTANGNFGTGSNLGGANFVVGSSAGSSFTVTNLTPSTTYHFAVVEFNGSGTTSLYQATASVAVSSHATLSPPTVTTSSFFANNVTSNRMQLTWTNGDGAGRLIVAKAGAPVSVVPPDLTDPASNSTFGGGANLGSGNYAVFDNTTNNFNLIGLEPATTYHFASYEYNGTGVGKVYLSNSIGRASFTTAAHPSVAPKNLSVSSVNGDRLNVSFTSGNGTRRLVVVRKGGLVNSIPSDLNNYSGGAFGAGTQIGTGNYVISFSTSTSATITGLEPNTQYGVAVFEVDGSAGNERYLVTEYINELVKTSSTPTIATFSLLYNSLGSTSVNLSWTNGNGDGRMVVLRPYQPVTFEPTVLSTHGSSSANYASTSNNLGTSHKHIQRGTGTTVTITNLAPGTTYHVAIYEYNGSTQPVYIGEPLRGFFTTLPTSGLAIGGFDAITFCPSQQVDVPYYFTGVLNPGNQLSIEMSDITGSFASPTVLGTQSTVNVSGTITSNLPTSLTEGTGYRLRVRATNPNVVSPDNGVGLQVATSTTPSLTIVGGQSSSCGTPIQLMTSQPGYNVQWFKNSTLIPHATASTYSVTETGNYQVRIAGASGGCQLFSASASITISQRPTFSFTFPTMYCENEIVDLQPSASPSGGTFIGSGINNGILTATTAGIGQHLVDYTYVDAVSSCSYTATTTLQVASLPSPPVTTAATGCQGSTVVLTASGATATDTYQWYTSLTGNTAIAGETLASYSTPALTSSATYFVSINNSVCESVRTPVIATINPIVVAPTTTSAERCDTGIVTLSASGSVDGNYRWYTSSSAISPIAGEVNNTFTTPSLLINTTYYVSVVDGICESDRTAATATINNLPIGPAIMSASRCGTGSVILSASGASNGEYRWYTSSTGGTALSGEVNATFSTPSVSSTTAYYVAINNGICESGRLPVIATINALPEVPLVTPGSVCGAGQITLGASGATNGQYRWYTDATTTISIPGEVNGIFTTPSLSSSYTYYVAVNNGMCESDRTPVTANINIVPVTPLATPTDRCGMGPVTLKASGGIDGQYRWYTDGGITIVGEVNSQLSISSLEASTIHYVSLNNGLCEGNRTSVAATINSIPSKPVITVTGATSICPAEKIKMTAPVGFNYLWSNGATSREIEVSDEGLYSVIVKMGMCESVSSDAITVIVQNCNQPPAISTASTNIPTESKTTMDLSPLISDPDGNVDFSTLKIISPPASGARASVIGKSLFIDYKGIPFVGHEEITIEICDSKNACTQQIVTIEVTGDVVVYNGLSPNGDDKNPFFILKYIDALPETKSNKVSIFNRWGDMVWEGVNYDNTNVVFAGQNKNGNDLATGTYFYKIEFTSAHPPITGYLSLKR